MRVRVRVEGEPRARWRAAVALEALLRPPSVQLLPRVHLVRVRVRVRVTVRVRVRVRGWEG